MSTPCVKHPMTKGDQLCSECGHHFCRECVVFPFGDSKPALCITCALEMGGIRRYSTDRPKLSRRTIRERIRSQRRLSAESAEETDTIMEPVESDERPWLEESTRIDSIPGGWSETFN